MQIDINYEAIKLADFVAVYYRHPKDMPTKNLSEMLQRMNIDLSKSYPDTRFIFLPSDVVERFENGSISAIDNLIQQLEELKLKLGG